MRDSKPTEPGWEGGMGAGNDVQWGGALCLDWLGSLGCDWGQIIINISCGSSTTVMKQTHVQHSAKGKPAHFTIEMDSQWCGVGWGAWGVIGDRLL